MVNYKTVFTFGKYKGRTVKEILIEDPSYLLWADNNVEGFELGDYLRDKAEDFYAEENCYEPTYEDLNPDWGDRD